MFYAIIGIELLKDQIMIATILASIVLIALMVLMIVGERYIKIDK